MTTPRAPFSRRSLLAATGSVGAGTLLTACAGGSSADAESGTAGKASEVEEWSFTDDRGVTARARNTPRNIVAFVGSAAALHDFGIGCTGVFGPTVTEDGSADVQAGGLAVERLTVLGNAWGEFNVEQYAALAPELLVTNMFTENSLWYVPEESRAKIEELAPTVGISVAAPTTVLGAIERYAELAGTLGADLTAGQVTADKARFEAAAESLRQAARDSGGLRVLACSGAADLFYVSDPGASADLSYFAELGVEIIVPENTENGFFEALSWENADAYDADLLLLDNRSSALQPAALDEKPTWNELPAVQAGQVVPWVTEPRYSYAGCAPVLEDLAAAVRAAKRLG